MDLPALTTLIEQYPMGLLMAGIVAGIWVLKTKIIPRTPMASWAYWGAVWPTLALLAGQVGAYMGMVPGDTPSQRAAWGAVATAGALWWADTRRSIRKGRSKTE